jgi:hypothetical protein
VEDHGRFVVGDGLIGGQNDGQIMMYTLRGSHDFSERTAQRGQYQQEVQ